MYGLYRAKRAITAKDAVIVVEGYFDLLAMHKNGFDNSVATMGTAITAEHLRLLKEQCGLPPFDSDGRAGAQPFAPLTCL